MDFHEPVMVTEVLEALSLKAGDKVADLTLGSAGHGRLLAGQVGPGGALLGMDRDPEMLRLGRERLQREFPAGPELHFAARPYEAIGEVLRELGWEGLDAILVDLGVNSLQLEEAERGFSFGKEGPLDGRFNRTEETATMAELVNNLGEAELAKMIRDYSDERHARRIAGRIVAARAAAPFRTTTQLADVVSMAYPPAERHGRIHPATRTFQALRIAVNDELGAVERGIAACMAALAPGGRLAVIAFHSTEARIVKALFHEAAEPRPDPANPYSATTTEGLDFEMPAPKSRKASAAEAATNPRARSAVLRVLRRKGGVA